MNYKDDSGYCYFHPREYVIGVCALCLNERLLILAASKQTHLYKTRYINASTPKRTLQKIFALTSLVNRVDNIRPQKSDEFQHSSSTSPEDSFISIKFEDNGVASWDKDKMSKITLDQQYNVKSMNEKKINSVVEHAKPRAPLRWRKRISQLFQLMKWKSRSSTVKMCHVGTKLEGAKVKQGWIRILTKRRTKS